jgi:tetratricopeptide (TPR) repeat protein
MLCCLTPTVIAVGLAVNYLKAASQPPQTNPSPIVSPTIELTARELLDRGDTLFNQGNKQEAIAYYDRSIALEPKNSAAYMSRGFAHSDLDNKQGAIADYTKAIALDPKSPYPYSSRGHLRLDLGDKQGAIADWQKTASLYLAEGKTKDYQETIDKIKQIQP